MGASTVTMVAYIPALKLTTVANATLIAVTVPFCTALLAWAWLRERPAVSALLASVVAFLGVVVMMSGSTSAGSRWGDCLAVVANMAFATALVVIRRYRGIPMVPAACLSSLLGTIVSVPFASPWAVSATDLRYLVLFGLVQMTLGLTLFTIGSRLIPAVEKRHAEDVLARAWQTRRFPCTILRLPMVNSECDHFHRVYGYILRLRDGGPILLPTRAHLSLRHVYGADVVQAIVRLTQTGMGDVYNLSQEETLPVEDFLALLACLTGCELRLTRIDKAVLEAHTLLPDCSPFSDPWMSELDNRRSKIELGL